MGGGVRADGHTHHVVVEARRAVGVEAGRVVNERHEFRRAAQLGVQLDELVELRGLADRHEEGAAHAGAAEAVDLLGPRQSVVPAKGSAQVAQEDDHGRAVLAEELGRARARAAAVGKLHAAQRRARD